MPNTIYRIALRHRSGPLHLDIQFTIEAPWTALFAPSGAGKTTILRMIGGLESPDTGSIVCVYPGSSRQLILLDTERRLSLPSHKRAVRLVAQQPALFPHLSVIENVLYCVTPKNPRKEDPLGWDTRLDEIISLCRIAHLLDKAPSQLSGGERQRVAIARAIAATPTDLLMLDEPFTGLESDLRDQLINDLRAWLDKRGIPVLLVTHDVGEVFAANAHVLKMESGRITASGPAAEVLAKERDRLIARLIL